VVRIEIQAIKPHQPITRGIMHSGFCV